jgi:hypothetical protein
VAALVGAAERAADHDLRIVVGRRPWPDSPELAALDLAASTDGLVVTWGPLSAPELADRIDAGPGVSPGTAELASIVRSGGCRGWRRITGRDAGDLPGLVVRAFAGALSSAARACCCHGPSSGRRSRDQPRC